MLENLGSFHFKIYFTFMHFVSNQMEPSVEIKEQSLLIQTIFSCKTVCGLCVLFVAKHRKRMSTAVVTYFAREGFDRT